MLSQAILAGASTQLRNKATTGGNLLQRTRCPYFYDTDQALQQARARVAAARRSAGLNRMNAVLGASDDCIAAHPVRHGGGDDGAGCAVETVPPDGSSAHDPDRRALPSARQHAAYRDGAGAGRADPSVLLPPPPAGRQVYRKVRDRASFAFALVSVAAVLAWTTSGCARRASHSAALSYKPWRSADAEAALVGARATRASFDAAGVAALKNRARIRPQRFQDPACPPDRCARTLTPTRPASSEENDHGAKRSRRPDRPPARPRRWPAEGDRQRPRMPMNTRRKATLPMASSSPQRSARAASSASTCAMQNARPACCWC